MVVHIALRGLHLRHGRLEGHLEGGRRLSRKAQHGQAVRPVGGDFKLRDGIVQANRVMDIRSGRQIAVVSEHKNAVFNCIGEIVHRKPQFTQGAEHAVARHAAQLALFDLFAAVDGGMIQRDGDKIPFL